MSGLTNGRQPFPVGCCITSGSFMPQSGKASNQNEDKVTRLVDEMNRLLSSGYDFAELTVGALVQLNAAEFEQLKEQMKADRLTIPVFNSFIPPTLKLTGPDVRTQEIDAYVALAMSRIQAVGGEIIIFGSGAARRAPEAFSKEQGMEQIKDFLRLCDRHAQQYGIVVAIEPLNNKECNMINRVGEALDLARELSLQNVRVLADAYHMHLEKEPLEVIPQAVADRMLAHVHYAEFDRSFPDGSNEEGVDLAGLLSVLQTSGYRGRISAECMVADAAAASGKSLGYVQSLITQMKERGD
ncbi:sugar phosphate isomerase/epimerase [Paenibacillus sp. H1-7]|uniref:sugar phosphate isomerase/epimerase family protein n=1 Tax=Paenibacillus sp. H1-7 TaxID=2282849 RepID=UPI001EF8D31A|nr:sugar phosphate isomerase/epimerase family protein [Paenibacillus sp. H1-7]ULL15084.1 sugar phosphate isomerase/epimerase [Paenibacillus sp. H1-7]